MMVLVHAWRHPITICGCHLLFLDSLLLINKSNKLYKVYLAEDIPVDKSHVALSLDGSNQAHKDT